MRGPSSFPGIAFDKGIRIHVVVLHRDAGAVVGAQVGPDRDAVFEIEQDGELILNAIARIPSLNHRI